MSTTGHVVGVPLRTSATTSDPSIPHPHSMFLLTRWATTCTANSSCFREWAKDPLVNVSQAGASVWVNLLVTAPDSHPQSPVTNKHPVGDFPTSSHVITGAKTPPGNSTCCHMHFFLWFIHQDAKKAWLQKWNHGVWLHHKVQIHQPMS